MTCKAREIWRCGIGKIYIIILESKLRIVIVIIFFVQSLYLSPLTKLPISNIWYKQVSSQIRHSNGRLILALRSAQGIYKASSHIVVHV